MRNKCPSDSKYARVPGEWPIGKFGKLSIIPSRQVGTNFTNLLFDKVVIVDQPFRGGGDRAVLIGCPDDPAIRVAQRYRVVTEPARQRMPSPRLRGDRLRHGKTSCMLLNALNAEKLFANWLAIVPWEIRLRTFKDAPNKAVQDNLPSARSAQCARDLRNQGRKMTTSNTASSGPTIQSHPTRQRTCDLDG